MKGDDKKITKEMLDNAIKKLSYMKDYTIPKKERLKLNDISNSIY